MDYVQEAPRYVISVIPSSATTSFLPLVFQQSANILLMVLILRQSSSLARETRENLRSGVDPPTYA